MSALGRNGLLHFYDDRNLPPLDEVAAELLDEIIRDLKERDADRHHSD
jgi:hypothetical protein